MSCKKNVLYDRKKLYSHPWSRHYINGLNLRHTDPDKKMYVYHVDTGLLTVSNNDPSIVYDPHVAKEVYDAAYEHAKSCVLPRHKCVTPDHFNNFEPFVGFNEDTNELYTTKSLYRFFDDKVNVYVSTDADWDLANREVGQVQHVLKDIYDSTEFFVKYNDGVE